MIDAHYSTLLRFTLVFCTVIAALVNSSCSSTREANANSPTGGISLEMSITGKDNLAVNYRVDQDGSLHFGGGLDAQINKTSWTGQLSSQEVKQLVALLNEHGWFKQEPDSSSIDADRKYSIDLRWPDGHRSFDVTGKGSGIAPIEELLARVTNRRHDEFLESLPKPMEPPD